MHPDWINGLLGGLLIGSGAGLLLLANGRIAGISGIVGQLIDRKFPVDGIERLMFIVGLIAGPLVYVSISQPASFAVTSNIAVLIIGGIIVGIGTSMGSGCTSGHGVSGAARLSKRSVVAMLTFMSTGIATVYVLKHII